MVNPLFLIKPHVWVYLLLITLVLAAIGLFVISLNDHNNGITTNASIKQRKIAEDSDQTLGIGRVGLVSDLIVPTSDTTLQTSTNNVVTKLSNLTPSVDPNNSTTTLLANAATFTGPGTDVSRYSTIVINLMADQNGTLFIDFSSDGSNWDITTVVAYTASAEYTNRVVVVAQYYRLRFTNSGSLQTTMRLQTLLGNQSIAQEAASIDTTGLAISGVVSTANSTTTPLSAGSTFTGSGEDIKEYSIAIVSIATDQQGLVCVDYSSDASNWDLVRCELINADKPERFSVKVEARYCRIRFINQSASDQTYLRLQTLFSVGAIDTGSVSYLNSTFTALSADQTFTGTFENVSKYSTITVNASTDENATLYADFSTDGTNLFNSLQLSTGTDSSLGLHTFVVATKYFRTRVVNGSTDMGSLSVQTIYNEASKIALPTSRLNSGLSDYTDAVNTRAIGFGKEPSGDYTLTRQNGDAFTNTTNLQGTLLDGSLNDSVTTITVDSTSGFDSSGTIAVGSEEITYTGTTATTFTGCTRGANNTTAAAHDDDSPIGEVFDSGILDMLGYTQVQTHILASHNGTALFTWQGNSSGTDPLRTVAIRYTAANDGFRLYSAPSFSRYIQYKFYNLGGSVQTDFFLNTKFLIQALSPQILGLDAFIAPTMSAQVTRSVLTGQKPNDEYTNVRLDSVGHLEVAVHDPLLPFGSMHTEQITPIFQIDGVYGVNDTSITDSSNGNSLGGSLTTTDSAFVLDTTTNVFGNATMQSTKRIRYRSGQGSLIRFTAKYTTGVTNTYQVAGMGHSEDGYYIGYKNDVFGILHVSRNLREIATLTISGGATSANDATITLGGTAYTVPLTDASGDINRTVWDISTHEYDGWTAEPVGATVVFIAGSAGVKTNTYTYAAGSTGSTSSSFVRTRAGDKTTYPETFIPQTTWNEDVLDGSKSSSNPSGVLLDPTKFNVWSIGMQYLGAGSVVFSIMTNDVSNSLTRNNATWTKFHSIENPNSLDRTHVGNPSFPFTASVYKLNSATDLTLRIGSIMAGVEGKVIRTGPLISYRESLAAIDINSIQVLYVIYNSRIFNGVPNQSIITLRSISAAANGNNSAMTSIFIIKNGTLTGNPTFAKYDDPRSCALYSNTTGMDVTFTNNSQLVFSGAISGDGEFTNSFDSESEEFDLQPGNYFVIGAQTTTSTSTAIVSINTREDH